MTWLRQNLIQILLIKCEQKRQALVKEYLEQAENGDLTHLPNLENVEYDVGKMEAGDGIVFFVPIGQALNLPLLGNLGPKIPIRFHIIGNVQSNVISTIREFGINNAYCRSKYTFRGKCTNYRSVCK